MWASVCPLSMFFFLHLGLVAIVLIRRVTSAAAATAATAVCLGSCCHLLQCSSPSYSIHACAYIVLVSDVSLWANKDTPVSPLC